MLAPLAGELASKLTDICLHQDLYHTYSTQDLKSLHTIVKMSSFWKVNQHKCQNLFYVYCKIAISIN